MNTLPDVAIIDIGLGNLFSIRQACEHVSLSATLTSEKEDILHAHAVILPGVGAFGDAMDSLKNHDLVGPIKDVAASGKPLIGICLGLQLMMSESHEFGHHEGLGIFKGPVVRFDHMEEAGRILKVPHIGWNRINPPPSRTWDGSPCSSIPGGCFMYFVHSYYVAPEDEDIILSTTRYGDMTFCSSVHKDNIFACQFHPERSGPDGLTMYREFARIVEEYKMIKEAENV